MTAIPPGGHGPKEPEGPPPSKPTVPGADSKDAFLLQSPFAKMFRATGAQPTVKQIKMIIDGILKQQITAIKKSEARMKKAMKKLGRQLEGKDN